MPNNKGGVIMADLKLLSDKELIELYGACTREMRERGITRTNSITGEIGEHIVVEYYNADPSLPHLSLVETGVQGYDAYDRKGRRYSIKTCTGKTTGAFFSLNDKGIQIVKNKEFDFVVVCKLSKDFELEAIYELSWDSFIKHKKWAKSIGTWNLLLTNKTIADSKIVFLKK